MIKLDEYGLENLIYKIETILTTAIKTKSIKNKNLMITQALGMINGLCYLLNFEDNGETENG